jgi:uncharacterized protein DUF4157/putative zinc-binding metallo-peptidase
MTRTAGITKAQNQPPPAVVAAPALQPNQVGTEFFDMQRDAGNRLVGQWLNLALRDSTRPIIQRKPATAESTTPAEQQANQAEEQTTQRAEKGALAPSLIVEDDAQSIQPGQMRKGEFLTQLRTATNRAAEESLAGTMWSSMGCPYIERWFGHYEGQSAQHVERAVQRFVPEARGMTNARDYIPLVTNRLRRGIAQWRETGQPPSDMPEEFASGGMPGMTAQGLIGGLVGGALSAIGSAVGGAARAVGRALFKEREGGADDAADPEAIRAQLGSGRSLDGGAKSKMESAFGANFSSVRIHTDAKAQTLSKHLNARAFTVGSDIAFDAGEYNPGTMVGDALIAHELAHVAQQQGGEAGATLPLQKGQYDSSALEDDADTAAVRAVVGLWGRSKTAFAHIGAHIGESTMPALKSGLQLQRCSKNVALRSPKELDTEYNQIRTEILAGLAENDPARAEIELDLSHLWQIYNDETQAAGNNNERKAELQKMLSDNLKRMKETVPLQVELTKRYKINFTSRESGVLAKGEIFQSFRAWNPDELKAIDRVLSKVPPDYLKNVRKIERSPRVLDASVNKEGSTPPPGAAALWKQKDQKIEIYNQFFQIDEVYRPGALLHEIGHSTVIAQDPKTTGGFTSLPPAAWMALSDWKTSTTATLKSDLKISDKEASELVKKLTKNKETQRDNPRPVEVNGRMVVYDKYEGALDKPPTHFLHYSKKEDKFVSDYARTHPAEDFAESFSHYLHDPDILPMQDSAKEMMGDAKWGYLEKNFPQKLTGKL